MVHDINRARQMRNNNYFSNKIIGASIKAEGMKNREMFHNNLIISYPILSMSINFTEY